MKNDIKNNSSNEQQLENKIENLENDLNVEKKNESKRNLLDQKFQEVQEVQEAELLIDFDKCLEEKTEKPYKIVFAKKGFLVPRQMPFDFSIFFFRHCLKKEKGVINMNVPEEKMLEFIRLMFGNEMLRALEIDKRRVGLDEVFEKLAKPIMAKWGYGDEVDQKKLEKKILLTQE